MSDTNNHRSTAVEVFWNGPEEEHRRKLADMINALVLGQTNNGFTVTLEPNETTTEVEYQQSKVGVTVTLTPNSASGAASYAAGNIWVEPQIGKAIIHHDSAPTTDRKFFAVFIG